MKDQIEEIIKKHRVIEYDIWGGNREFKVMSDASVEKATLEILDLLSPKEKFNSPEDFNVCRDYLGL